MRGSGYVPDGVFIEVPIILTRTEPSILLLDEEEGGSMRQLGFTNLAGFEVFIDELLAHLHFFGIHQIGFGHFWGEGFFEINSMVKGSSRGKLPILWLIKNLGALSILWREFLLHSLSCLG